MSLLVTQMQASIAGIFSASHTRRGRRSRYLLARRGETAQILRDTLLGADGEVFAARRQLNDRGRRF